MSRMGWRLGVSWVVVLAAVGPACSGIERGKFHPRPDGAVEAGDAGAQEAEASVQDARGDALSEAGEEAGAGDAGAEAGFEAEAGDAGVEAGEAWVPDVPDAASPLGRALWWPAMFAGGSRGGGLTLMPFAPAGGWSGESAGGGLVIRPLVP